MGYLTHLLTMTFIYSTLAVSLDLLAGETGILSIGHAAFYALGAYAAGLLAIREGCPFTVGLIAGMSISALGSLVVSLPSMRLRDEYFMIATFAFQVVLYGVLNNWIGLTNGPLGVSAIPRMAIFGLVVRTDMGFLLISGLTALAAYWIVGRLRGSPFGRVLRAIREDETFAQCMGKNTVRFKIIAFAVSAALAASSGCVYAYYLRYIDPSSFTVMESILVLSMVIIGGAGNRLGPPLGAAILVFFPEALRFLGLPDSVAANLRQVFYGSLLVAMLALRPSGIVGSYGFRQR